MPSRNSNSGLPYSSRRTTKLPTELRRILRAAPHPNLKKLQGALCLAQLCAMKYTSGAEVPNEAGMIKYLQFPPPTVFQSSLAKLGKVLSEPIL
jgi:hypothetical protein